LRGGAGLVRVFTPASIQPVVAASEPSLMTVALPETSDGQIDGDAIGLIEEKALGWAHVVAIGPGLGPGSDDLLRILAAVFGADIPVVGDADGLNAGRDHLHEWLAARRTPAVITPHPGEMARLRAGAGLPPLKGDDDEIRVRIAHEYASCSKAVVVLKGHRTVVATADRAYINTTGNAGMATGGMGDVLTGLIAALIGQGMAPFDAARLGVHAHGHAGDLCAKRIGPIGYLAREVADALPVALEESNRAPIGFR